MSATISYISLTFRENWSNKPLLDEDNPKPIFLQRQMRGYKRDGYLLPRTAMSSTFILQINL